MKRLLMISVIAMLIAGAVSAQTVKEQKGGAASESASVEAVRNQLTALKDKVSAEEAKELEQIKTALGTVRKNYQAKVTQTVDSLTKLKEKVKALEEK